MSPEGVLQVLTRDGRAPGLSLPTLLSTASHFSYLQNGDDAPCVKHKCTQLKVTENPDDKQGFVKTKSVEWAVTVAARLGSAAP